MPADNTAQAPSTDAGPSLRRRPLTLPGCSAANHSTRLSLNPGYPYYPAIHHPARTTSMPALLLETASVMPMVLMLKAMETSEKQCPWVTFHLDPVGLHFQIQPDGAPYVCSTYMYGETFSNFRLDEGHGGAGYGLDIAFSRLLGALDVYAGGGVQERVWGAETSLHLSWTGYGHPLRLIMTPLGCPGSQTEACLNTHEPRPKNVLSFNEAPVILCVIMSNERYLDIVDTLLRVDAPPVIEVSVRTIPHAVMADVFPEADASTVGHQLKLSARGDTGMSSSQYVLPFHPERPGALEKMEWVGPHGMPFRYPASCFRAATNAARIGKKVSLQINAAGCLKLQVMVTFRNPQDGVVERVQNYMEYTTSSVWLREEIAGHWPGVAA